MANPKTRPQRPTHATKNQKRSQVTSHSSLRKNTSSRRKQVHHIPMEMHSLARFDVAQLGRRACIDNAWYFEFPRKIRRKLIVLTETAQHQNLRRELVPLKNLTSTTPIHDQTQMFHSSFQSYWNGLKWTNLQNSRNRQNSKSRQNCYFHLSY